MKIVGLPLYPAGALAAAGTSSAKTSTTKPMDAAASSILATAREPVPQPGAMRTCTTCFPGISSLPAPYPGNSKGRKVDGESIEATGSIVSDLDSGCCGEAQQKVAAATKAAQKKEGLKIVFTSLFLGNAATTQEITVDAHYRDGEIILYKFLEMITGLFHSLFRAA